MSRDEAERHYRRTLAVLAALGAILVAWFVLVVCGVLVLPT